ncbi:helix-turn-helix family protein [Asticcacaulis biprosthecium C19]|uniref:Helix-turn-helix family protein n=1 Tax=Asticcacaulis biprosthecium C19 TaxID=715226 RepID=F4QGC0_9CAUL|nr:helix-turn-helix transcriptional regulator [Asticcacaulis biprosthecium]EGF92448.1 helix-turn-helix family protein [Asticcacaulis biprosthecium C19]
MFDTQPETTTETGPNKVDLHVGARVRLRRKLLGLSQDGLAARIDLTFQQVQKYERGSNRISASKLYEIAQALQCKVEHFFEGLETVETEAPVQVEQDVNSFLCTPEGIELAGGFPKIRSAKLRRRVLELVNTLAEGGN